MKIKLPAPGKKLMITPTVFMRLGNGGHQQTSRNDQFGITIHAIKKDRNSQWEKCLILDAIPDKEFKKMFEVREYIESIQGEIEYV